MTDVVSNAHRRLKMHGTVAVAGNRQAVREITDNTIERGVVTDLCHRAFLRRTDSHVPPRTVAFDCPHIGAS